MRRRGRCLCGAVKIETSVEQCGLDICHCKNCQLQTGGPFAAFLALPLERLPCQALCDALMTIGR